MPMVFDSTQLVIGDQTQYFFDDLLIESVENVRRTFHSPVKVEDAPVIRKDKPWEHFLELSCNSYQVLRDPRDNLFKAWYTDWERPDFKPGQLLSGGYYRMFYAQSENGIDWVKPNLGLEVIDGHKSNSILGGNGSSAYNMAVIIDPLGTDESRRFKSLLTCMEVNTDGATIRYATSGDGIHWKLEPELPQFGVSGNCLDDVIILSCDEHSRTYIMNTRHYDMYAVQRNYKNPSLLNFTPPYYPMDWARCNKRRVWQCHSADMIHWSQPYLAVTPEDGLDGLDTTYYGLAQFPMGGVRVGFLNIMNYAYNDMNVQLVYTRDGHNWTHLNNRQPWLAPRGEGYWDAYMNTMACAPIRVGDELYFFHGGAACHHDWWICGRREGLDVAEAHDPNLVKYGIGLAKLRNDGFCSLEAHWVRPGILITRPLISSGERLVINASCGERGSIAVEVVDHNDDVIPGFSKEQCDVFRGDDVAHTVTWHGQDRIPVAAIERAKYPEPERSRIRKLRFYMRQAHLYSLALTSQLPLRR